MRLIAIVGPTASGKSDLAMWLAERFNGEIICADSRTVFRGMDIGTAKPGPEDRQRVPHHLLDIADPNQPLSAAEFKQLADAAILDITSRQKVPVIVGGSGLYVYSVLYDFQFPAGPRSGLRQELEAHSLEALVRRLHDVDPERAAEIDLKNKRRVVRALETVGQPRQRRLQLPGDCLLLGLRPDEGLLRTRIVHRTEHMFQIGLVDEVKRLVGRFGADVEAFRSPGYAEVVQLLLGEITSVQTQELIEVHTRQLAKRQLTWFKRNEEIRWLPRPEPAIRMVSEFLERKEV